METEALGMRPGQPRPRTGLAAVILAATMLATSSFAEEVMGRYDWIAVAPEVTVIEVQN